MLLCPRFENVERSRLPVQRNISHVESNPSIVMLMMGSGEPNDGELVRTPAEFAVLRRGLSARSHE